MRTRKRQFSSLSRDGRRTRRASTQRFAMIDAVLNVNEIDEFAGFAADIFDDLSRILEDHIILVEDLRNYKMNVERALKEAKSQVSSTSAQIKAFNAFEKSMMKEESLDSSLNDISMVLNKNIADAEAEVRFQTNALGLAIGELDDVEGNPMGNSLAELISDLDQDDTLSGLQKFSAALAELISGTNEDFIVDILGSSDGSRMLKYLERIGF
jgi:hypothetical protein